MKKEDRLKLIKDNILTSKNILYALGDENRQNILYVLLENCSNGGIRVDDIALKVNLSRPAVSHHLKILLNNGIVSVDHVGTKNYYHVSGVSQILSFKSLLANIQLYVEERNEE